MNWPKEPYKGLSYYDSGDVLLFAGREGEIADCAFLVGAPETRMLLLHGRTGCGKSSFLRAGLIPELESRADAYLFLRRFEADPSTPVAASEGTPVFVRCGARPLERIAEELYRYMSRSLSFTTAKGPKNICLTEGLLNCGSAEEFVHSHGQPEALMEIFRHLSRHLPHTLVMILDQAEEVATLNEVVPRTTGAQRSGAEQQRLDEALARRQSFFHFLRLFQAAGINVKFILGLRGDRFGEFFTLLQINTSLRSDVKSYQLSDLDPDKLTRAITLPTDKEGYGGSGSPYQTYEFEYETGLPALMVGDLVRADPSGGVLPAMQITCKALFQEVQNQPSPRTITERAYADGGRVTGRIDRHVSLSLRSAFRSLLTGSEDVTREEHAWRRLLYRLARKEADGFFHSGVLSEAALLGAAAECGVKADPGAVLDRLADPEFLIVRRSAGPSGEERSAYSLGHDALALSLHEWYVRDEEAERHLLSERVAAENLRKVQRRLAIVAVLCLVALLFAGKKTDDYWRGRVDSLRSAVLRMERSEPGWALFAAAHAALTANETMRFRPGYPDLLAVTSRELAEIVSELPDTRIAPPRLDSHLENLFGEWQTLALLPNGDGIAMVSDGVLSIRTYWPEKAHDVVLGDILGGVEPRRWAIGDIASMGESLALLIHSDSADALLLMKDYAVGKVCSVGGLSAGKCEDPKVVRQSHVTTIPGMHARFVGTSLVTPRVGNAGGLSISVSRYNPKWAQGEEPFIAGTVKFDLFPSMSSHLLGNGIRVDLESEEQATRVSSIRRPLFRPGVFTRIVATSALDGRAQLWNSDSQPSAELQRCKRAVASDEARGCFVRILSSNERDLLVLGVSWIPRQRRSAEAKLNASPAGERPEDQSLPLNPESDGGLTIDDADTLVVMNSRTGRSRDFKVASLPQDQPAMKANDGQGNTRGTKGFSAIVAGNLDSLLLGVVRGQSIDLYDTKGSLRRRFTKLSLAPNLEWSLDDSGTVLLGLGDKGASAWNLPATQARLADYRDKSPEFLISLVCERKDMPAPPDRTTWFDRTGLFVTEKPESPCKQ